MRNTRSRDVPFVDFARLVATGPVDEIARILTVTPGLVGLTKNAPHPNAGLLFVEFMTSKEGQQIFQKANYLPARADVAPLTPELIPERGSFTATVLTPAITDRAIDRWDDIFKQLFR